MDHQLHRFGHVPRIGKLQHFVHLYLIWCHECAFSRICLENGAGNEGKDVGRHDQALVKEIICCWEFKNEKEKGISRKILVSDRYPLPGFRFNLDIFIR